MNNSSSSYQNICALNNFSDYCCGRITLTNLFSRVPSLEIALLLTSSPPYFVEGGDSKDRSLGFLFPR
ncbi:hypothetical protein MEO43_23625, partial [Dolichospermum sp. ST_sed5]|nr:hypothetical protein [Dolichospermum sp. ST_sed5]